MLSNSRASRVAASGQLCLFHQFKELHRRTTIGALLLSCVGKSTKIDNACRIAAVNRLRQSA